MGDFKQRSQIAYTFKFIAKYCPLVIFPSIGNNFFGRAFQDDAVIFQVKVMAEEPLGVWRRRTKQHGMLEFRNQSYLIRSMNPHHQVGLKIRSVPTLIIKLDRDLTKKMQHCRSKVHMLQL